MTPTTTMGGASVLPTDRPLTAGDYEALSDLHTIKGWLHGLATNPDLNDVVADGGVTTGDCYQQEAREFAARIGRVIAALASPPSERERELEGALRHYACSCEPGHCAMSADDTDTPVDDVLCGRLAARALTAQPAGEGK